MTVSSIDGNVDSGTADADQPLTFFCPIEPVLHPRVDEVEHRSLAWLAEQPFAGGESGLKRLRGTRSAEFYARITATALIDPLVAASDWCYWGFSFDDVRCDSETRESLRAFVPLANRIVRVLETPWRVPVSYDPHLAALSDVVTRMRGYATDQQLWAWAAAHRSWLSASGWQIARADGGELPELTEYLEMRLYACGGAPTTTMIEIVEGIKIPAAERDSPAVRALTEMVWMVAALDNDLVSYRRERAIGHGDQNIVGVLTERHAYDEPAAALEAMRIRDRVLTRYLKLRNRVERRGSAELRLYLTDLTNLIRGNLDWSLRVPRYQVDGDAARPLATLVDISRDDRDEPLPIPSLAWWWDRSLG